jgi:SpoVK/Ycf46/Vps4 family AAA+-type ATPase
LKLSNKLFCLDSKIDLLHKYCEVFLNSDENQLSKFSQLSVYPTFLFDGFPGTGKSSVANIIYEKLKKADHNIDVVRLNIDELISHNFGESSSNLREYFRKRKNEIKENNSYCFIIMDEVDSFTINRYQNDNESIKRILLTFNTIIDELVRSGEIYRYIIVATTNIKESIDASILRRFYFKENFNIELDEESFRNFLLVLNDLTSLGVEDSSISEIFELYRQKKYTLGEVKSVFSRLYVNNLISGKTENLDPEFFREYETFYEITQSQKVRR